MCPVWHQKRKKRCFGSCSVDQYDYQIEYIATLVNIFCYKNDWYKNDAIHWQVPWRPVSHLDFTQPHSSRRSYKALKGYLLRGFRECIHRFLSSCEVSCHEKVSQASLFHSLSFHKTPTLALAYCDVSSSGNDLLIHRLILPFFIHSHDPLGLLTHAECLPSQSSSYRR